MVLATEQFYPTPLLHYALCDFCADKEGILKSCLEGSDLLGWVKCLKCLELPNLI
jgi:hypothetical protein